MPVQEQDPAERAEEDRGDKQQEHADQHFGAEAEWRAEEEDRRDGREGEEDRGTRKRDRAHHRELAQREPGLERQELSHPDQTQCSLELRVPAQVPHGHGRIQQQRRERFTQPHREQADH
jgi:hypothetical protein